MSQLFKTNLEEYARQCTLQRRRYEECMQQVQQSCAVGATEAPTDTKAQDERAGRFIEGSQLNSCLEQAAQSCLVDLLEMPANLLGWDDEASSDQAESEGAEKPQRYNDRARTFHQTVVNPMKKSPSPVGFGAP